MSRPPRVPGFRYQGLYRYFLTLCTFERQAFFLNSGTVVQTLLQFRNVSSRESFEILAYCFMPDHAHLLVEGVSDRSDLRRFIKLSKQRSGGIHARSFGGPLWQDGYYDRILRDGDDILAIARYLLNNPIRAGLVKSPADYPHMGSDRWSLQELIEAQQ